MGMIGTALADILGGDDGAHAGQRVSAALASIDADAAVRDGAAQDRGVQHILARQVVDILSAAAQEPQILGSARSGCR